MSWTDDHLQRLREKMALAKRQGGWVSAADSNIVLDLIRFWLRSTKLAGHNGVSTGKLPTIADSKAQGIRGVIVECRRRGCGNRRRLAWDDIGLPESMVFVAIAGTRRFRCYRCQGREVIISADWPKPKMGLGDEPVDP